MTDLTSIEIRIAALRAKVAQMKAMAEAAKVDSFAAYWAGSASASVAHHYSQGAVREVAI